MLIAHERNKLASSALRRFVGDILGYLLHTLNIEVTIELKRAATESFQDLCGTPPENPSFPSPIHESIE